MRGSPDGLSGGHTYLCSYLEVLSWTGFSLLPVDLSASRPAGQPELPHMEALASRERERPQSASPLHTVTQTLHDAILLHSIGQSQ